MEAQRKAIITRRTRLTAWAVADASGRVLEVFVRKQDAESYCREWFGDNAASRGDCSVVQMTGILKMIVSRATMGKEIDRIIAAARRDSRCVSGSEIRALCDEVERLRKALAVYADEKNWGKDYTNVFCYKHETLGMQFTAGWVLAERTLNDGRESS